MNKFSIDKLGWIKIGKGALVAIIGALLTYVAQTAGNLNFGEFTPIVVALMSILVNAGRKWIEDYSA